MNFPDIINKIENIDLSLKSWLLGFFGIVFVRFFLENLSSASYFGVITSDLSTLIHYFLFYFSLILVIGFILRFFTHEKFIKILKVSLFFLPLIWLAPLIDIFVSLGQGIPMAYNFKTPLDLFYDFFTYFGTYSLPGITPGIRLEILLILLAILVYLITKLNNIFKIILACLICYLTLFIWVSLPSFIFLFTNIIAGELITGDFNNINNYFSELYKVSFLAVSFLPTTIVVSSLRKFEILFNISLSQIYYLIIIIFLFWGSLISYKDKVVCILKNSRPNRLIHFLILLFLGLVLAISQNNNILIWNWFNLMTILIAILTFYTAWMFAVGINDLADVEIDKISNPNRPLIKNCFEKGVYKNINLIFLLTSLVGGFLLGHTIFFLLFVFTMSYYIYSAPPLRFKRIPIISSFLVAIPSLTIFMSGFFLVSLDQRFNALPKKYIFFILVAFTIIYNLKDIKDYQGDKENGISTLPVLFGLVKSKKIIGNLLMYIVWLIPLIVELPWLWFSSIPAGILFYIFINLKKYQEKYIFFTWFGYIFISFMIFLFLP